MISLVPSESWGGFKWVRASARKWGVGPCPAQCIWQGSGFAADQTNAMLAVVRADDESLVPPQAAGLALSVARPLPTETASLGFGGNPVGGGDKNSHFTFFRHFYVGVVSLTSGRCGCVGTTPRGVYFGRKTAFSEWVLCADGCVLFPPAHSAFLAPLCGGGITTLGVRFMPLKRWTPAGHGGLFAVFMPPQNPPCAG